MDQQTEGNLLEAKQEELVGLLFPWLKEQGLAHVIEQVRVTITVLKKVRTSELSEEDWSAILLDSLEWTDEERAFLLKLKTAGNEPTELPDSEEVPDYRFAERLRTNLCRDRGLYSISEGRYDVEGYDQRILCACVTKLLTPKQPRRFTRKKK